MADCDSESESDGSQGHGSKQCIQISVRRVSVMSDRLSCTGVVIREVISRFSDQAGSDDVRLDPVIRVREGVTLTAVPLLSA